MGDVASIQFQPLRNRMCQPESRSVLEGKTKKPAKLFVTKFKFNNFKDGSSNLDMLKGKTNETNCVHSDTIVKPKWCSNQNASETQASGDSTMSKAMQWVPIQMKGKLVVI